MTSRRKDSIKNGEKGRKSLPLRQILWGVLTVFSLGTRVVLANVLSAVPVIGVAGIWWAVPIGWLLADIAGFGYYFMQRRRLLCFGEKGC